MRRKKDPVFRDMVRTALVIRSENGNFLKDDSGKMSSHIKKQFNKFSFLKEDSIKKALNNYLNNIDRGI
jgi:hypothetical protein